MTFARFSGHLLLAFILGVALASFSWFICVLGACLCLALYLSVFHLEPTHIAGLLLCFCFGVWRFDAASVGAKNLVPLKNTSLSTSACLKPVSDIPFLTTIRTGLSERIKQRLPGDEGALLAGTLYGERGLSSEMKLAFRNSGMTHLVAVSGSNLDHCNGALFAFRWTAAAQAHHG